MKGHSEDADKWLRIANCQGVGPVIFGRLLEKFGSPEEILNASMASLAQVEGIGGKTAEKIFR